MSTPSGHRAGDRWAWGRLVLAVSARPRLWRTAVSQLLRLAPDRWWQRAPFLPLPAPDYLHFRMVTAFGTPEVVPPVDEVISYLEWCRAWPGATNQ